MPLAGTANQSFRIFRSQFHLQRLVQHRAIPMTSLTRLRSPASSSVPPRLEKRPRLEIAQEEEVVAGPSTSNMDEDVPTAEPVNASKVSKKSKSKRRKQKRPVIEPYSSDDVLYRDVISLLKNSGKLIEDEKEWDAPLPFGTEVELVVSEMSSTGMFW